MRIRSTCFRSVLVSFILGLSSFTANPLFATSVDLNKIQVITNSTQTVFLLEDGSLWSSGRSRGDNGFYSETLSPQQFVAPSNWAGIVAGGRHFLAIKNDGTLWSWGENTNGQLGDDSRTTRSTPSQIGADRDWIAIAAGNSHSVALKSNGRIWTWGSNNKGQLGVANSSIGDQLVPRQISPLNCRSIAGAENSTFAIDSSGRLWGWGDNSYTKVTPNGGPRIDVPILTGDANKDGTPDTDWVSVAGGEYHTLALKSNGSLWTWGIGPSGQLGIGPGVDGQFPVGPNRVGIETDWVKISANHWNNAAIKADGSLWTWGANYDGTIGDGTTVNKFSPTRIGTQNDWAKVSVPVSGGAMAAVKTDGTFWTWGSNYYGQLGTGTRSNIMEPTPPAEGHDWVEIAVSRDHFTARKTDGTIWAWGNNWFGMLGDGTVQFRAAPVAIEPGRRWAKLAGGTMCTAGLGVDGSLWFWGGGGSAPFTILPTQVGMDHNWRQIAAGAWSATAIKNDGSLWQTPRFSTAINKIGDQYDWKTIAQGYTHYLALRNNGTLWAWGQNIYGQLGIGNTSDMSLPVQVGFDADWFAIAVGENHSVALKQDGSLWAWGLNDRGQLGDDTRINRLTPIRVGNQLNWLSIAAGTRHTVALQQDGTLWSWGDNGHSQLGTGDFLSSNIPKLIGSATDWATVSAYGNHTGAVKRDGTLRTWGFGYNEHRLTPGQVPFRSNNAPVFDAIAPISAVEGTLIQFTVSATDPDGDSIYYYVEPLPQGALFDSATRIFSWIPGYNQEGTYTIVFYASDNGLPESKTGQTAVVISVNEPTPIELISQIIDAVYTFSFPKNIENSYMANLKNAEKFINNGKTTPEAVNQLYAALNKVQADLKQSRISESSGNTLSTMIDLLINKLNPQKP